MLRPLAIWMAFALVSSGCVTNDFLKSHRARHRHDESSKISALQGVRVHSLPKESGLEARLAWSDGSSHIATAGGWRGLGPNSGVGVCESVLVGVGSAKLEAIGPDIWLYEVSGSGEFTGRRFRCAEAPEVENLVFFESEFDCEDRSDPRTLLASRCMTITHYQVVGREPDGSWDLDQVKSTTVKTPSRSAYCTGACAAEQILGVAACGLADIVLGAAYVGLSCPGLVILIARAAK